MHAGDRILHPEHGAGSVLALKWGHRVRVRLDAAPGLPKTFRRVELTELGGTESNGPADSNGPTMTVALDPGTGRRGRQTAAGRRGPPRR